MLLTRRVVGTADRRTHSSTRMLAVVALGAAALLGLCGCGVVPSDPEGAQTTGLTGTFDGPAVVIPLCAGDYPRSVTLRQGEDGPTIWKVVWSDQPSSLPPGTVVLPVGASTTSDGVSLQTATAYDGRALPPDLLVTTETRQALAQFTIDPALVRGGTVTTGGSDQTPLFAFHNSSCKKG